MIKIYHFQKIFRLIIDNFDTNDFIHELWNDKTDGSSKNYDVCLLKSQEDIFQAGQANGCGNGCVNAACMPKSEGQHGDACWVAGWGHTEYGGNNARILQEIGVNIFSNEYCHAKSIYGSFIQPNELCAGLPDKDGEKYIGGDIDSCFGDSGGPLICEEDGKAVVTGVVSWGEKCAVKGFPGIYGRVYHHSSWIETTIADNS